MYLKFHMNNSWPIPQCGYEPYVRERQQQQLVTWTCAPSLPALDRMKQRYGCVRRPSKHKRVLLAPSAMSVGHEYFKIYVQLSLQVWLHRLNQVTMDLLYHCYF